MGNATQVITVKSSGSYATVTAWAKGTSGWKSVLSTTAGRVGSNGVVDGATRRQNTYTTPSGTYTLTEGFGVEAGGTNMPYTRLNSSHWWVEDPESKYYNSMHSASGVDFPLTESGDRGSEHLIDHPTQYAKALVINFNRWPATPGRGAGLPSRQRGRVDRRLRVGAARHDGPDHGMDSAGGASSDRHRVIRLPPGAAGPARV
ncbi:hypothetical protein [Streptomyces sp. NPDC016845]|uniref:hypothetical protein n=1 Tax=Streptomyces sp. NPDC016845 TaxID=3364972 RepID=UPI003790F23A